MTAECYFAGALRQTENCCGDGYWVYGHAADGRDGDYEYSELGRLSRNTMKRCEERQRQSDAVFAA